MRGKVIGIDDVFEKLVIRKLVCNMNEMKWKIDLLQLLHFLQFIFY